MRIVFRGVGGGHRRFFGEIRENGMDVGKHVLVTSHFPVKIDVQSD